MAQVRLWVRARLGCLNVKRGWHWFATALGIGAWKPASVSGVAVAAVAAVAAVFGAASQWCRWCAKECVSQRRTWDGVGCDGLGKARGPGA